MEGTQTRPQRSPKKLAAGGSGEDLWIAGASVFQSNILKFISSLLLFFVLGLWATP